MNDRRKEEAIAIIEAELEHHRAEYREAGIDEDPLAEVIVRAESDHVLFIYDGCGHEYFTYYPDNLVEPRKRLFAKLEEAGFFAEDRNNWSMRIWEI